MATISALKQQLISNHHEMISKLENIYADYIWKLLKQKEVIIVHIQKQLHQNFQLIENLKIEQGATLNIKDESNGNEDENEDQMIESEKISTVQSMSKDKLCKNKDGKWECNYCHKLLSAKQSLILHTRIHTGEKPFKCTYCNKKFRQNADLIKHIRVHTGEKPYKCNYCKKAFKQSSGLIRHIRTHTGEKPYKCSHCSKGFKTSSSLKNHNRIHTGEKPFQCTKCRKKFRQSSYCNKHIRECKGIKC